MKKLYAFEIEPEFVDSSTYLDFDEECDFLNAMIGGNKEYHEFNYNIIKRVRACLEDCLYDWPDYCYDTNTSLLNYHLPKKNGKRWSGKQVHRFVELAHNFRTCKSYDEDDIVAEVLSIIYAEPYTVECMCGCCQRDYQYIFIPEKYKHYVDELGSYYFNTGMEYMLCDEPCELEEVDEVDKYGVYITAPICYHDDKIKQELKQNS